MKPLALAILLTACASTDLGDYGRRLGVSNGYIGDVCFEREDPRACIEEAARDCAAGTADDGMCVETEAGT